MMSLLLSLPTATHAINIKICRHLTILPTNNSPPSPKFPMSRSKLDPFAKTGTVRAQCLQRMLNRAVLRHAHRHLRTALLPNRPYAHHTTPTRSKKEKDADFTWRSSTVHEGVSWACVAPRSALAHPRHLSRDLRHRGSPEEALQTLELAGALHSRHDADLLELLLAQLETTRFKGARERLNAMSDTLWRSPTAKSRAAFAVALTACAREAARDNTASHAFVLDKARTFWGALLALGAPPDSAVALMFRISGDCRSLPDVRSVRTQAGELMSERVFAAYLLALGKCGRSSDAEVEFFSASGKKHRGADGVLAALFRAHVASSRIARAEQMLAVHGCDFLMVAACNAFVRQCAMLQLHKRALDFVGRMREEKGFPRPNAGTYNLLLKALCAGTGTEDRAVAADRALALVDQMNSDGIAATTVTYNTLIRTLVLRAHVRDALRLYRKMPSPNRITFSHLMQGAADARDAVLARALLAALHQKKERPNYGFCKSYLETIARVDGLDAAFESARELSHNYAHILVFGDVGGREAVRMALMAACGKVHNLTRAFEALRFDLGPDTAGALAPLYTATVLMQVCIECGALGRAIEVFESLKLADVKPNFEVYESLIYGLASHARLNGVDDDGALARATDLVREMHSNGCARSCRQAAFLYNTLIAAAGRVGDFELGLQIFNKMSRHTNPGVVYIGQGEESERRRGMFVDALQFPTATIGTYNSMIDTAWRCGSAPYAFQVYDMLVADRINEPNAATYNLLADIALFAADVDIEALQRLLKDLDRVAFVPEGVAKKRVQLRQKVLALRWS